MTNKYSQKQSIRTIMRKHIENILQKMKLVVIICLKHKHFEMVEMLSNKTYLKQKRRSRNKHLLFCLLLCVISKNC